MSTDGTLMNPNNNKDAHNEGDQGPKTYVPNSGKIYSLKCYDSHTLAGVLSFFLFLFSNVAFLSARRTCSNLFDSPFILVHCRLKSCALDNATMDVSNQL